MQKSYLSQCHPVGTEPAQGAGQSYPLDPVVFGTGRREYSQPLPPRESTGWGFSGKSDQSDRLHRLRTQVAPVCLHLCTVTRRCMAEGALSDPGQGRRSDQTHRPRQYAASSGRWGKLAAPQRHRNQPSVSPPACCALWGQPCHQGRSNCVGHKGRGQSLFFLAHPFPRGQLCRPERAAKGAGIPCFIQAPQGPRTPRKGCLKPPKWQTWAVR